MKLVRNIASIALAACIAAAVVAQGPGTAAGPGTKQTIKRTFTKDASRKYKINVVMTPVDGDEPKIELAITTQDKVASVAANGNATVESKQLDIKISFNGQEVPVPSNENNVEKQVVTPTNQVVSMTTDGPDADFSKRLSRALSGVYAANEVAVGDSWKVEYKADKDTGMRGGTATEKLLGYETVNGVKCAKISHKFTEAPYADDQGKLEVDTVAWVDVANGELIKAEGKASGIVMAQMGDQPMKMNFTVAYAAN